MISRTVTPQAGSSDLPQIPAKALDAGARILERRGGGRIGDAERRTLAERGTLHHRDAFGFQQFGDEVRCRIDSVAPLPAAIHNVMLGLERKMRLSSREKKRLSDEEKDALKFVADFYPANPIDDD